MEPIVAEAIDINTKRKQMGDKVCAKYGIKIRQVEKKEDLFSRNISASFKPKKNLISIR